jgi:hypothetical protein
MHRALLGVSELAELFGVSKQAINQRLKSQYWRNFPQPEYVIAAGRIWTFEQLDEYIPKQVVYSPRNELARAREKLNRMASQFEKGA